jgi:hypothetical protein
LEPWKPIWAPKPLGGWERGWGQTFQSGGREITNVVGPTVNETFTRYGDGKVFDSAGQRVYPKYGPQPR